MCLSLAPSPFSRRPQQAVAQATSVPTAPAPVPAAQPSPDAPVQNNARQALLAAQANDQFELTSPLGSSDFGEFAQRPALMGF